MGRNYFPFLICILFPLFLLTSTAEKRTRECQYICKAIRFPGKIGGCNCNFNLFTKRSSEFRTFETEIENLEQLRQNMIGNTDLVESVEIENEGEGNLKESSRNLIDLFRRQIMNPFVRDY